MKYSLLESYECMRKQIHHKSPGPNAVILGFSGIINVTIMERCCAEFHQCYDPMYIFVHM